MIIEMFFSVIFSQTELYPIIISFLHYCFVKPKLVDEMDIYLRVSKLSARISVFAVWIIRGCKETPEEMVEHMKELSG